MLVELRDAVFGYGSRPVVRVEALHVHAGRCLGIFGPNGAGKTTLVRGIVGLLAPLRGERTAGRATRFGYLPQHRAMDLHWPMTALDAASLAISARRPLGRVGDAAAEVRAAMGAMGVEDLARRPFARLSGGEQQRVLLAGALADAPQALVLDEPTDGLDVRSRGVLLDVLRAQAAAGLATVVISHDVQDLLALGDEIAWLHPGDVPGEPSHVEMISPDALAERVLSVRTRTAVRS